MARRKQATAAIPYLRRIAEDEYVQKQLSNAAMRLREVYRSGARQGSKAAEDKKLYGKVREAATSIRKAVGAIEEPPAKPTARGRRALTLALVVAAALLAKRARAKAAHSESPAGDGGDTSAPETRQQTSAEPIAASTSA